MPTLTTTTTTTSNHVFYLRCSIHHVTSFWDSFASIFDNIYTYTSKVSYPYWSFQAHQVD